MSIDVLPNEIIMYIMRKFALQDRILLRAVSPRWKMVIEDMCNQRRSLMLMQDIHCHLFHDYDYSYFDYDYLVLKPAGHDLDNDLVVGKFSAFNELSCQLLAAIFPNLDRLVLQLSREDDRIASPMLYYLLENCWPNLLSLSLMGDITFLSKELPQFTLCICNAINSMKSLKHLDLFATNMFPHFFEGIDIARSLDIKPSSDLSETLSCLEHFAFTGERCEDAVDILPKLGSGCTSLELHFDIWFPLVDFRKAVETNGHLANLTQLRLHRLENDLDFAETAMPKLHFVCETFTNLRSLFLGFGKIEFPQMSFKLELFKNIAKLSHLTDLTLKGLQLDNEGLDLLQDNIENGNCPRITSVKRLAFSELFCRIPNNDFDDSDDDADVDDQNEPEEPTDGAQFCKTLAFIFPKLEQLAFMNYFYELNSQFGEQFVVQLYQNMKYFEHLHTNFIKSRHDSIVCGRHKVDRF